MLEVDAMRRCPAGFRRVHGECKKKTTDESDEDHYASYTLWSKFKSQDASHYIPERTYSKFYVKQLLDGYSASNPDRDYIMLPKGQDASNVESSYKDALQFFYDQTEITHDRHIALGLVEEHYGEAAAAEIVRKNLRIFQ